MPRKNGVPTWINMYYVMLARRRGNIRTFQEHKILYKAAYLLLEDMEDWARHLDNILTMSGEKLLEGNGSVSHQKAIFK
ncbi:hypothetical protein [Butyrivibrio sp. AE3004]|uniref:hypothetical protein n=1 Tax=Butyrivibrio sp. AE3004 TaxID=1506994 RepID=UPI000493EC01|nr:hypothetical protein [Butyrivibrio sp. AE3004]